jgi:hypothetical protein
MKLLTLFFGLLFSANSIAFDIYALGTSNTNCKGVDKDQSFTVTLEKLLRNEGHNITVINGGVNGDKPQWMLERLKSNLTPSVKIVIFEPGPNEPNRSYNLENTESILSYLQQHRIPTIYVSNGYIQHNWSASRTANRYNAYYYGGFAKGTTVDREYRQFDLNDGYGGHLTAKGCQTWASQMAPLVKKVLDEQGIKSN